MDDELKKSLAVPALAANRFYALQLTFSTGGVVTGSSLRLAFGEAIDGQITYHQAVNLSEADAVALRDRLNAIYPPAAKAN